MATNASMTINYSVDGDEIRIACTIRNNGFSTKEFRVFLFDNFGSIRDKEPDLSWRNIKAGQSDTILINSKGKFYDIDNDLFPTFRVALWEQHDGFVTAEVVNLSTGKTAPTEETHNSTYTAPPISRTEEQATGGVAEGNTTIIKETDESGSSNVVVRKESSVTSIGGKIADFGGALAIGLLVAAVVAFAGTRMRKK